MGFLQCSAFQGWCLFFFCLFINEVLPRQSMSPNHPSFWGPGSPVFSSTNGRGPAALKLFDQVSCRETLCINWHIGTTTEAPLVNNYWSFKLWPQLSPVSRLLGFILKEKKQLCVRVWFFSSASRWVQGFGLRKILAAQNIGILL